MPRKLICLTLTVCGLFSGILFSPAQASEGRWALLVGVGQFSARTAPNPGSAGDATDVRQFLLSKGWQSDHIRVLTDSAATAPAIRSGLDWLGDNCGSGSVCVFKYSGHVRQQSGHVALWSYENAFIQDDEVAQQLRRLQGSAWIDISGCEAAAFDKQVSSSKRVFTASSQANEKSYESPTYRNSVWTEYLVNQGLAGKAGGAGGYTSLAQAFAYAAPRAAAETSKQRRGPQHPYLAGGDPNWWFGPAMAGQPAAAAQTTVLQCLLLILCF